jgi:hypothetical protein
MPNFKQGGRGFKMKGFSPFTKKTDPPKTKSNANQTDERVFNVNQEKYDKWNRLKNLGKGPDVRYLGAKENKSHLDKYTKWKKEDGKFIADDGTPMKKKTDPPTKQMIIRELRDLETGEVVKRDTTHLVPITEKEFFGGPDVREKPVEQELHRTAHVVSGAAGEITGGSIKPPKPPRQKNKKPKTGLGKSTGKGGLKLSPLKKDDDTKNQKKMRKDVKEGFIKNLETSVRQGLKEGVHETTHGLSTQISSKKKGSKRIPAIPRKNTQFNEANASEKAILRQMNTIEGQLSKIKDKNSNRYKNLTNKHRDLDNQLWSYD